MFIFAQTIIELGLVYLFITAMRKWFKKNEKVLIKLGAIFFVLSFLDLFTLQGNDNIIPIIIVIWLFYSVYKQGGLFED